MLNALAATVLVALVAGCSGAATPPPSPSVSQAVTSAPRPTATVDPVLASAVADALATIDEIDRLYRTLKPSGSAIEVIGEVATKGRSSLAREPARITTMAPFHVYDLSLQLFEANAILQDGSQLVKDHDWLTSSEVRGKIAALVP